VADLGQPSCKGYKKGGIMISEDRKKIIKEITVQWILQHPYEMGIHNEELRSLRSEKVHEGKDKFAVKYAKSSTRLSMTIPPDLYLKLVRLVPDFFKAKEERMWFKREFKMFAVSKENF